MSKGGNKSIGSIEVLAYGTAVIPQKSTRTNWQTGRFKQPLDLLGSGEFPASQIYPTPSPE